MDCCKLVQVEVRKWLNYFFTQVHDYDNDYSLDLMELLPHRLKQQGILRDPLKILQEFWTYSENLGESCKILKFSLTF